MSAPTLAPLRGSVAVRALMFGRRLLGDVEAGRRLLAWWRPGARVFDVQGDWLLVLADEVRLRCDRAPGLPFVRSGGRLLAASAGEVDGAPADALVWLEAGGLRCEPLTTFPTVDVSGWLDTGPFETLELAALARPPAAPRVVVGEAPPLDARAHLGVGPAAAGVADLRRLLLEGRRSTSRHGPGLWSRIAKGLRQAFARWTNARAPAAPRAAPVAPAVPRPPSWWARLRSRLASSLMETRLAQLIGRQHARYIRRMLELFESGDVQDALRHAIPLGDDLQATLKTLSLPRPRASLAIDARASGPSSAVSLGDDLYHHLHRTYRSMFERLKAQGRLEEAAFVLAELLRADAEAVAFLETHGRLKLAAELAEGRGLPIGLQVRQWFVAGDRMRALGLALRHGAFADAALRLDKQGPAEDARAWRLMWADALAEGGDLLGAAEVVAGIAEADGLVAGWLDGAIAQGGPTGARALVRKLSVRPQAFADLRERALALLSPTRVEDVPARVAFAEAVSVGKRSLALAVLARVGARTLVRDLALHGPGRIPARLVERMIAVGNDGALRADVPSLPDRRPPALLGRVVPLELEWTASDVGRVAATDAAFLPDGRVAVALGELGLRLYHRDGRVLAHFDQPAHRLAVADRGDRLIALAPRGETQRLARIDLTRRRAESWCEAPIARFTPDYDGRLWFVGMENDLYAIDAAAERFEAVWRVPDLAVLALARGERLHVLAAERGRQSLERYSYELPGLALRGREPLPDLEPGVVVGAVADEKGDYVLTTLREPDAPPQVRLLSFFGGGYGVSSWVGDHVVCLTPEWLVTLDTATAGAIAIGLVERRQRERRLRATLAGAQRVHARVSGSLLTLADDRGRVIVIDLLEGILLRDLRVG